MCRVYAAATDLQHSEGGYLPPLTVVSAQRLVTFPVLVPPVSHGRPTVYLASEYRPCMWYASSANPDTLSVACPESSKLLQHCAPQINTNNRLL